MCNPTIQLQSPITEDSVASWALSLAHSLLDSWLASSMTANGIFHPNLDRQWRKTECSSANLVSQCRLIYNFSQGFRLTAVPRFRQAALGGVAALSRFFLAGDGGYRWGVSMDGAEVEPARRSYGHAFVILALATAAEAFRDTRLTDQALAAWRYTRSTFADRSGGLMAQFRADTDFGRENRSQNPLMHVFEALMALSRIDESGEALTGARDLLAFMRALPSFESGSLIELYGPNWSPLSSEHGGVVNIGHQFEWAFLLSDWSALTGDAAALDSGHAFLSTGLTYGVSSQGGVWDACEPNGKLTNSRHGLWQQAEAIRATRRYERRHGRGDAGAALSQALAFYNLHYVDAEFGGVYAAMPYGDRPGQTHKGDPWKLDYHSLNMALELMKSGEGPDGRR